MYALRNDMSNCAVNRGTVVNKSLEGKADCKTNKVVVNDTGQVKVRFTLNFALVCF